MRKHLIGTILVLAALAACNKEVETPAPVVDNGQGEVSPGKVTLTFKATIDDGTRTSYDADLNGSWVAGDAITVCVTNDTDFETAKFETAKFTTTDGETFSGTVTKGYTTIVSGVYPADDKHVFDLNNGKVTSVYLSDTYSLGTANDGGTALPMVGEMEKGVFTFHHICGALKITVVDIFNALTFTTAGEAITGDFELDEETRRIKMPENGTSSTVTFNYDRLQKYLDDGNFGPRYSRTFYIPVPDGTLSGGATMALKSGNNVVYEKQTSTTNSISFNSNVIKHFKEIGLNPRNDWSITPDLSGINPVITFDPHNNNQLYIRLTTTMAVFNDTYHGCVEAFLEARIQSSKNGTQKGLKTYTPQTDNNPATIEEYLQDPEKLYIMCGVDNTEINDRKCDLDYYVYSATIEDPATDSYKAWLGQWTVADSDGNTDTWTITRKEANNTYVVTGLCGNTTNPKKVEALYNEGNLKFMSQYDFATAKYNDGTYLVSLIGYVNNTTTSLYNSYNEYDLMEASLTGNNAASLSGFEFTYSGDTFTFSKYNLSRKLDHQSTPKAYGTARKLPATMTRVPEQ